MTPFLQFRTWLRQGPSGERVAVGLVLLLVVGLMAWAALPVRDDEPADLAATGSTQAGADADPTGAPPAEGPTGGAVTPGAVSTTRSNGSSAAAGPATPVADGESVAADDTCTGLRATDQGVSPSELFVAVSVINLAGEVGNETFGARGNLEEVARAAAAGINDAGGVACRTLRIKVYKVNPLDQNEQRSRCLEIINDKPFAVIDFSAYISPVARSCFVEAKLPYEGVTAITEDEAASAFPYMYSVLASTNRAARNWVFGAAARGWFSENGFQKLGLLLEECDPKTNAEILENLTKAGVPGAKQSLFTVGGCNGIASPGEISQAVVKHRNDGATHVFLAGNISNSQNYVRQAESLRWSPKYVTSDFSNGVGSSTAPNWPESFDGARAITSSRVGERYSGILHPEVVHCNDWMTKGGVRPSEEEKDSNPLAMCQMFRLFDAAASTAGPNLSRTALVDGLAKVGRFQGPWTGDAVFDRRGKVFGGDFIRAIQWHVDCRCWKVVDGEMRAGY